MWSQPRLYSWDSVSETKQNKNNPPTKQSLLGGFIGVLCYQVSICHPSDYSKSSVCPYQHICLFAPKHRHEAWTPRFFSLSNEKSSVLPSKGSLIFLKSILLIHRTQMIQAMKNGSDGGEKMLIKILVFFLSNSRFQIHPAQLVGSSSTSLWNSFVLCVSMEWWLLSLLLWYQLWWGDTDYFFNLGLMWRTGVKERKREGRGIIHLFQ